MIFLFIITLKYVLWKKILRNEWLMIAFTMERIYKYIEETDECHFSLLALKERFLTECMPIKQQNHD